MHISMHCALCVGRVHEIPLDQFFPFWDTVNEPNISLSLHMCTLVSLACQFNVYGIYINSNCVSQFSSHRLQRKSIFGFPCFMPMCVCVFVLNAPELSYINIYIFTIYVEAKRNLGFPAQCLWPTATYICIYTDSSVVRRCWAWRQTTHLYLTWSCRNVRLLYTPQRIHIIEQ